MDRARTLISHLQRQETLNFWLTNRIPRRLLTTAFGRVSRIRSPRLARIMIRVWQLFADDLRLDEAACERFDSLHDCFIRRLKADARPVSSAPGALTSPCDAVVGAHGNVSDGMLLQAKGMVYRLDELLADADLVAAHRNGTYVTLRLKSSMYHRFHAPCSGRIRRVNYVSGEVYNVNPPTLRRVERLFCRNERAVVPIDAGSEEHRGPVTLVPVAAVLVASMRFTFLGNPPDLRRGPNRLACDVAVERGDELGWFEHGSTIVMLAGPGMALDPRLREGAIVRMGRPLLVPEGAGQSSER